MVFYSGIICSYNNLRRLICKRTLITSTVPDFKRQNALLPQYIVPFLEHNGDRIATVDHVAGTLLTHGQCAELTGRIANLMIDAGIKPGDHIAVASYNHIMYLPLVLGIIAAGGTPALCNPSYVEREMEGLFATAGAHMAIGHHKNSERVDNVCKKLGLPASLDVDTILDQCSSYSSVLPSNTMDIHDTCCLFFSSGTTGFPKAVEITHDNFVSQLMAVNDPTGIYYDKNNVLSGFLPTYHVFGCVMGMYALQRGAKNICLDGFNPVTFLESITQHKIDFAAVVPPVMMFLAKHPLVDKYDLTSLKELFIAAAPLSERLERAVRARLGDQLYIRQAYGSSEVSGGTTLVAKGTVLPGSVGHIALNHTAKIVNVATGEEVEQGCTGEILIKGPCVMKGYLNNPTATKEVFTEDGYLKTGDIGYVDKGNNFYIVDRLKEFIKVKGFQVAPAELEALLLEHPGIADSAVIGVQDERTGETPKAFIVLQPGVELTEADVKKFVADNASDYKVPSQVEFIKPKVVPKAPSGKILRKELRQREAKSNSEGQSLF